MDDSDCVSGPDIADRVVRNENLLVGPLGLTKSPAGAERGTQGGSAASRAFRPRDWMCDEEPACRKSGWSWARSVVWFGSEPHFVSSGSKMTKSQHGEKARVGRPASWCSEGCWSACDCIPRKLRVSSRMPAARRIQPSLASMILCCPREAYGLPNPISKPASPDGRRTLGPILRSARPLSGDGKGWIVSPASTLSRRAARGDTDFRQDMVQSVQSAQDLRRRLPSP